MITEIKFNGTEYTFAAGKSIYRCPDKPSLEEVRQELLKQKVR